MRKGRIRAGPWARGYTILPEFDLTDGGLVVNRAALKAKYSGGIRSFARRHPCLYNRRLAMVMRDRAGSDLKALENVRKSRLAIGWDYILLQPFHELSPESGNELPWQSGWLCVDEEYSVSYKY